MGICSGDTFAVPTWALKPAFRLETMGGAAADHANDRSSDRTGLRPRASFPPNPCFHAPASLSLITLRRTAAVPATDRFRIQDLL
jgi:hypothetical protein